MLTHSTAQKFLPYIDTEHSWMQWIPFKIYDSLPHYPIFNPEILFLENQLMAFPNLAWHSRYKCIFPHSLSYRMMRCIASNDLPEIVKVLKDPKFNPNQSIDRKYGYTPIQLAAMINRYATIEVLLMYGADINSRDKHGNTPLMMAVYRKNYETIHTLLKNGCDIHARNNYNMTATDKAQGNQGILQFLKAFQGTQPTFPRFKINLPFTKLLKHPLWEDLKNVKVYEDKATPHPLTRAHYILGNSNTLKEFLRIKKRREEAKSTFID